MATVQDVTSRLLIVDDDRDILAGTRRYFERVGYRVDCAAERAAAETLVAHNHYHCIVVDAALDLPQGTDGLEIVPFLRAVSPLTSIVVLTGNGGPGLEEAAMRHGVDAFLRKPQRLPDLARTIEKLVGRPGGH